jgi:hypothetical protein
MTKEASLTELSPSDFSNIHLPEKFGLSALGDPGPTLARGVTGTRQASKQSPANAVVILMSCNGPKDSIDILSPERV